MSKPPTSTPPAPADDFVRRHVGPDDDELRHMLDTLGADTLDALLDETLPESIRDDTLDLPLRAARRTCSPRCAGSAAENSPARASSGWATTPPSRLG